MAREVVDVDEVGPLVVQEAGEIAFEGTVAERVARPRIPLGEVVDHEPGANAAIVKLRRLARARLRSSRRAWTGPRATGLANRETPGVGLGAGMVEGRPALHHVDDARRAPGGRGTRGGARAASTRSRAGRSGSSRMNRAMVGGRRGGSRKTSLGFLTGSSATRRSSAGLHER